MKRILILGCGYVGGRLALACMAEGMQVLGMTRSEQRATELERLGFTAVVAGTPADLPGEVLSTLDAIVDSIPLSRSADGVSASQPDWLPQLMSAMPQLRWAAYLSTTGVYGDAGGAWVDEAWSCRPTSLRGAERLRAEQAWLAALPQAEVFRLAGIYGPGRNILERLRAGGYKAVQWQPPHWSSRIHVDDIVAALMAAMQRPRAGRIVNLADDVPLPHAEYVTQAAQMIDAPSPVLLTPEDGEMQLSPMALEFFRDNKRVSNRLLHAELLPELAFPDFRAGLASLLERGQ